MLFHHLPFCDQLLIWAARKWVAAPEVDGNLHQTLQTAFRLAKAPRAYIAFDGFLTVLFASTTRTIDFRSHRSPEISADENRFLAAVAAMQVPGDGKTAERLVAHWMPPAGRRLGLEQCELLARDLALANHHLRPREVEVLGPPASGLKHPMPGPTTSAN